MARDLRSSALSALMGGQKPTPRTEKGGEGLSAENRDVAVEVAVPTPATTRTKGKTGGAQQSDRQKDAEPLGRESNRVARTETAKPSSARGTSTNRVPKATAAPAPAADGYVGRSQYHRKRRGLVSKVAVHLSPDVAAALRVAGAVGDENGLNMSEIVETLLVQAGYGS